MRLLLVAVGRMKAGPERELLERYMRRARAGARALGISAVAEVEVDEGRGRTVGLRKDEEARAILARVPPGSRIVMMDERGQATSSVELARMVHADRAAARPAFCFVIGGPDGLASHLLSENMTLAFGAVTFPHQLMRVLVAEQIYRITTILAGHPYHRA